MPIIYRYDRLATAENSLHFMVAEQQPIAGGYGDDDEGRAESARIIQPVHQVETVDQARIWIRSQLNELPISHIPGVTQPAYTIREYNQDSQPRRCAPGVLLLISAEGNTED